MTLSAPSHPNPLRGFRTASLAHREPARLTVPAGTITFPSAQAAHAQQTLMVAFTSPDGRTWEAIGGGDTLADAITFAQDSCPTGTTWQPSHWNDLYGG
jgi:hypothetical protein